MALRLLLRKRRYVGHIQWGGMSKSPTVWDNLYGAGALGIGDKIFSRDRKKFTETLCPTRVPWFGKFMRGSKLRMGVTKRQDFGVTLDMAKALLVGWDLEWK